MPTLVALERGKNNATTMNQAFHAPFGRRKPTVSGREGEGRGGPLLLLDFERVTISFFLLPLFPFSSEEEEGKEGRKYVAIFQQSDAIFRDVERKKSREEKKGERGRDRKVLRK